EFGNLLPWLLALVTWLVARRVLRMLATRPHHPTVWIADLLLGMWIFHPAWGMNWLLAGRVREFLPLAAFGLALLSLNRSRSWSLCWCGALAWIVIAQASHITGLLAWCAIGPAVYGAARSHGAPRPWRSMCCLLAWAALAHVVVWQGFRVGVPAPGLVAFATRDLGDLVSYLSQLTTTAFPTPLSSHEPEQTAVIWGGCCVLIILALLRRRPIDASGGSLVSLAIYGALVLLVVTDMDYRGQPGVGEQPLEFARESTIGAVAMLMGGYGLFREWLPRVFHAVHGLFLGAFLVIFAWDWYVSLEHLEKSRCLLRSEAAELVWEEVMPGMGVGRKPPSYSSLRASLLAPDDLQDLRERGLLGHLPLLPGTDLEDNYPSPGVDYCGEFHGFVGAESHSVLSGSVFRPAPGLVLIARKRGKSLDVLGVMRPRYDQGLEHIVATGAAPSPELLRLGDRLQAYGLEVRPLGLRPLRGVFEVRESGLVRLEDSRK
ncbi:MAG: hypothetical protein VX951_13055, partial [Planctomycetota bacterium]|nr:hypothetical protein [Planctomycetota bacterium]